MRLLRLTSLVMLCGICGAVGAQWQFVSGTSGPIYYPGGDTGIVGIGTNNPTLQKGNAPGIMIYGSYPAVRLFATGSGARSYQISTGSIGQFTIIDGATGNSRLMIDSIGRIGIGTDFPAAQMDVATNTAAETVVRLRNAGGAAIFRAVGADGAEARSQYTHSTSYTAEIASKNDPVNADANSFQIRLRGSADANSAAGLASANRLTLLGSGRVGINTATPAATFDVNGSFHVSGDAVIDGNIAAKYQDIAEWVPATVGMEAGTVVVLDPAGLNRVMPSLQSYDTKVAGVVSAQPGIILGEVAASKAMIATTGRVKVRVDATSAPIRIGDLLVSSSTSGRAMRSEPMEINGRKFHQPGTIIGKALESLEGGQGEILVLLSLQ